MTDSSADRASTAPRSTRSTRRSRLVSCSQPVAADARLADGKRHWLDRLYQRISATQESGQAREVGADLARRYPQDTSVQFSYLPVLRALEALNEGDPARAFEIAQGEAPYNVAMPGTAFFAGGAFFGALYPGYLRGLACSRLARPSDAAAEFQTVLDQPGLGAERSDRSNRASPTGQGIIRLRGSRKISRDLRGPPRPLERRRSRHSGGDASQG